MRAVYFLVVAATALLAGTTAASEDQTKLSLMTNTDAIQSLGDAQVAATKRFLRRKEEEEEEENDSDDEVEDEDEEERANLGALDDIITPQALNHALKDEHQALFTKLFTGGVPLKKFDAVLQRIPSGKLDADKEGLSQLFRWFSLYHNEQGTLRAGVNAAV